MSKKNMSTFSRNACTEFIKYLDKEQLLLYQSRIDYINGRFQYMNDEIEESRNSLMNVLKGGTFNLCLKALFMLLHLVFKSQITIIRDS